MHQATIRQNTNPKRKQTNNLAPSLALRVRVGRGRERYRKTASPFFLADLVGWSCHFSLGAVLRGARIEKMKATSPCGTCYQSNSARARNKAAVLGKPTRNGDSGRRNAFRSRNNHA
jgi:hypothetical protein